MSQKSPPEGKADLAKVERTLSIALLRTREAVMGHFRPMLQAHNVTEQQWRVLRVLREEGGCEANRLAHLTCVLSPSLSRMLKLLSERGFVIVTKNTTDARKLHIILTEQAEDFLDLVTPESNEIHAEIERKIGKKRIENLLDKLAVVLGKLEHK